MLIIPGSGSEETNLLLNLMREQDCNSLIHKIYLCAKVLSESKYQFLIKRRENIGMKHLHDPKAFMQYSNTMVLFTMILMITIQIETEEPLLSLMI